MEIVRSNFASQLGSIIEDAKNCDFISFDGEFTGISNVDFKAMNFDTVAERYEKLRKGNMNYLMCQVGLCMFSQRSDGSYQVKPYNFYVMPQQYGRSEVNRSTEFTCQASCINFLAGHGFNFNKVFLQGIPYLRPADESKIRDTLMEMEENRQHKSTKTATPIAAKGEDKKAVELIMKKVGEYSSRAHEGENEPLALEPCSAWRRKLTYQHVESKYGDTLYLQTSGEGRLKHITVSKVNLEQRREKEKLALDKKLNELTEAVGFSTIIKEISNCGKLVIGHNMLLDVMYIVSQFMAELPPSYEEFKVMCQGLLPKLLDTKVMSSTYLFKDDIPFNSLDEMAKVLGSNIYKQVEIDIPEGFPHYEGPNTDTKFHDAAYDAYVTGKCFAIMAQHIGTKAVPPVTNLASHSKLLTPFTNKVFLNRIQDIPYMNLGGPEVVPDRDHVYHLTFPTTWAREELNQVFFPSMISVAWINSGSAMVTLQDRTENAQVRKLIHGKTHGCVITTYTEWHKNKDRPSTGGNGTLQPHATKRKHRVEESGMPVKSPKVSTEVIAKSINEEEITSTDPIEAQTSSKDTEKLFEESSW